MPIAKKTRLFSAEEEKDIRKKLQQMELNGSYGTTSRYTPSSAAYPDGQIPFVDRHMNYLNANPKLDVSMYLANLRLMTRLSKRS